MKSRTSPIMYKYFLTGAIGWLCLSSLLAQTALEPSLGVAFPVKLENEKLVLTSPVLMNMNDLLPEGTILHKLFPKPRKDDKDVKNRKNKDFNTDKYAAVQRFAIENREVDPNKTAVMKAIEDRAGGDGMVDEMKFRAMLHRMNIEEYYLAYDLPGSNERRLGQFEYPEGLFLGEQQGSVMVLAILNDSKAQKLGIEAGSRITALNGKPLKSLKDFRDRYFTEKEQRKGQGKDLSMTVVSVGQTTPREVEFNVRRSLGNAEDMMSDLKGDMSKKTERTPTAEGQSVIQPVESAKPEESMTVPLIP
jgi:C-terminal processing protease CtpA/Prc